MHGFYIRYFYLNIYFVFCVWLVVKMFRIIVTIMSE